MDIQILIRYAIAEKINYQGYISAKLALHLITAAVDILWFS